MKKSLPISVCILISLALVLFGIVYGTVSGFKDDQEKVTELLTGDNGLEDVLGYRGADGHNLCVVARRHLTEDEDVANLSRIAVILTDESQSLAVRKAENDQLDAAVEAVKAKLSQTPSFLESPRDAKYLTMLESDLKNLSGTGTDKATLYNQAAQEFNQKLQDSLMGKLAQILGVPTLELYQ